MLAQRDNRTRTQGAARLGVIPRLLFARVEIWLVLLFVLIGFMLTIGFGAAVLDAERQHDRLGRLSKAALAVAEIPYTAKRMLGPDAELRVWSSNRDQSKPTGWSSPSGPLTGPGGYLLLSRYDGSEKRHKLELVSLPSMRTVFSWTLTAAELLKDVRHISRFTEPTNWDNAHFRQIHPWLEENGDLIVKDFDTPLFRVDPCGKPRWTLQDAVYHHSTEADAEGNLWIPSTAERASIASVNDRFRDDQISRVSPSGKLLFVRSITQVLMRHGYANWLFSIYNNDPTHLNDIQPVLADGPYWKKGDLFLSLRNVSAIMLYRPSTDEIVWIKRGPWILQHDVDILDDHRIGIYDNAVQERAPKRPFFANSSQVVVYDFATGKVSLPLQRAMQDNNVRTWTEGLFTHLPGGSTLIEDPTEARLIIFRANGSIAAQYVNRAQDGWLYHLGWSRYIDKAKGDIVLNRLRKVRCNA
jgi:arylsulfotransferase ASST